MDDENPQSLSAEDDLTKYGSPGQDPPVPASSIIVFHPGSKYLRFGRASDSSPETILHAIARKRKKGSDLSSKHKDKLFPFNDKKEGEKPPPEIELARLQLCHTLQTSLKSNGTSRFATPTQTIAEFNKSCKSIRMESLDEEDWKDFSKVEKIVGDQILKLHPDADFNIHFPWRRGQFNLHGGVCGSLSSVVTDMKDIWSWCITEKLGLSFKDLQNYRAVIVVPAMFERTHANEIFNLVVNSLGFGYAFLIQDHICASFGAGLSCATVVDVGDQKISVSCVEDAISFPQSRIELKYGCGDLNLAFWNLMLQTDVPISLNLDSLWDMDYLSKLKQRLCHLDFNRCGPEEHKVVWNKPSTQPVKYNVYFGDELLIVPLSYFNPDLLRGSISRNAVVVYRSPQTAPDDPFDNGYITETSRRVLKEAEGEGDEDDIEESKEEIAALPCKINTDKLLGIDQAILQSIDSCNGGEELKRRLYSCILIVGGGFKFEGLGSWLQKRISLNIPRVFKTESLEVITEPKDMDSSTTVWKGAAILSTLETTVELWIARLEWNTFGSRILRERSLCSF